MKKSFVMAAAAALLLSACSSEEGLNPGKKGELYDVQFDLSIGVCSDVTTRAARPLWSQEELQQVNDLKIYIFDSETGYVGGEPEVVPGFNNSTPKGSESHDFMLSTKLSAGTYTFLAVGREDTSNYTLTINQGDKMEDVILKLAENKEAAEIFVGKLVSVNDAEAESVTVTGDEVFKAQITLRRVVAGVLAYFKNIPYELPNKAGVLTQVDYVAVRLVAKGTETRLHNRNVKEQVNETFEIIKIKLSDDYVKSTNGNYYANEAKFNDNYSTVANSFLKGAYALPFKGSSDKNVATMHVVLCDEDNNELKSYPVKCKSEGNAHVRDVNFNIDANNFYSLGTKLKNKNTDPTDPTKPNPNDPDEPIDLTKEDVITVTVDAGWRYVHELELGEEKTAE